MLLTASGFERLRFPRSCTVRLKSMLRFFEPGPVMMLRGDEPNAPATGTVKAVGVEPLVDRRVRDRHRLAVVIRAQRAVDAARDIPRRAAHRHRLRRSRVGREIRAEAPAAGDAGKEAAVIEPALVRPEREAIVRAHRQAVALDEAGPGPLGVDVLIVLRDVAVGAATATADRRRVVARSGACV